MDLETSEAGSSEVVLKNWDFPKIHSQLHLFDDIIAKGATRNFNTKPNESLNRSFKKYYTVTNFQNVDGQVSQLRYKHKLVLILRQVLQQDQFHYAITFIESKIEVLDEFAKSRDADETIEPPSSTSTTNQSISHVYLGSPKKATTLADFTDSSTGNGLTYSVFRRMLEEFLNKFYQAYELPHERYLEIKGDQKVMFKSSVF